MRLERLILQNFLTYDYLDYEFERRPLLVQGLNLTDPGQASNGSGKSGMATGIEYCITATNSRDVRDNEIISYGYKEAKAELYASCDVRKEMIHIDWTIRLKGSNKLAVSIQKYGSDEWEEASFSNVNDGKKYIQAWFAISKEDLFNYFIINNTRFKSFFKSSNKEKVDLINRFSDASIIDGVEQIDTDQLQADFNNQETEISKLEGKIELTEQQIIKEKARDFEAELLEQAEELEDDIEDIDGEIDDIDKKIENLKPEKIQLEEDIREISLEIADIDDEIEEAEANKEHAENDLKDLDSAVKKAEKATKDFVKSDWNAERADYKSDLKDDKKTLKDANSNKEELEEKETKVLGLLKELKVILGGVITCPKCSHEFLLDEDQDLDSIKARQKKGQDLHEVIKKKISKADSDIKDIKDGISDIEEMISEINNKEQKETEEYQALLDTLSKARNRYDRLNRRITSIEKSITKKENSKKESLNEIKEIELEIKGLGQKRTNFESEIENLKKKKDLIREQIKALKPGNNEDVIKGLNFELSVYKSDIASRKEQLQQIGDEIYIANQWIANFKQFKMYLANQSLEAIEFHCNRYLSEMGGDLIVRLEGYRTLANGSLKDEITAKIIRGNERSFNSFSGGERGRLLFASILANRHMINSTHPFGGLDFLSVDEVFEGVDGLGLKYLIKSAKKLDITAMIITHVTDEETSQDKLTIEKVNGISRIKKD